MKLKVLILWTAVNGLYANNLNHQQLHSLQNNATAGVCDIEIINNSSLYATVYGTFDDVTPLIPFTIMPDNSSQYISLFYQGYCHQSMYLDIVDANGFHIYTKYTQVNSLIKLIASLNKQLKVETR